MAATGAFDAAWLMYRRDLLLAFRHWDQVAQPVVFFAMVTTLFPLALGPELGELRQLAGGVLWVAALLAALLGLEFLFRADHADGTLEQILLSGQPLALLALAKGAAHWTVCGLPLVLATPVLGITVLLQSSTATALIVSSFAQRALITGAVALAIMLGADVGSTIVRQWLDREAWRKAAAEMSTANFEATVLAAREAKAQIAGVMAALGIQAS